jgi:hypothetical protein
VNIAAFSAASEDPYQHGADGENQQCQPERNEEAGGKPTVAFLPGEQSVNSSRITGPAFLLVR